MDQTNHSISVSDIGINTMDAQQKIASTIGSIGLLVLIISLFNIYLGSPALSLGVSLLFIVTGVIWYAYRSHKIIPAGIHNDGVMFSNAKSQGLIGWVSGILITGFYVLLYWYPNLLGLNGEGNTGIVAVFDPLSQFIKGKNASQWFVYGTLYTVAILIFGVRFIWKYRHNKYQVVRTLSVMFFQLGFAFLIPELLEGMNTKLSENWFGTDMKNMWPLDYDFFHSWHISNLRNGGTLGLFMMVLGIAMIFIISPILTYLYGKRWYCSWVCGCGGLAETAGDPYRHLSSKKLSAWKLERWMIHTVLVLVFIMTAAVLYGNIAGTDSIFGLSIYSYFSKPYGFLIGAAFSGVIGVGFYPLLGSRVWCRFGCPMAALLGLQQKFFSRFRITTNGGQCISCGNCSTYCEMGIDVRHYAQRGQDIVRASCVGCGICSAVCPRGVLKLENGSYDVKSKAETVRVIHISEDDIKLLA